MCSRRKRSSNNERRPPAARIQPELDFSNGALAAALLILGILFYLLPVAPAPQRLVAHSSDTIYCRAADISGGPDRRHHQVATVVNSRARNFSFAASAQCYTSGYLARCFCHRLSAATSRASPSAFRQSASGRGDHRKCGGPLSRCGRPAYARLAGLMLLPGSLPAPLQGPAKRVLLPAFLGRRSCSVSLCIAPAALARPLHSFPAAGSRNFVTRSRGLASVLNRLTFWLVDGTSVQGTYVLLTALLESLADPSPAARVLFAWPLPKLPRYAHHGKVALAFAKRTRGCCSRRLVRRRRSSGNGNRLEGVIITAGLLAGQRRFSAVSQSRPQGT